MLQVREVFESTMRVRAAAIAQHEGCPATLVVSYNVHRPPPPIAYKTTKSLPVTTSSGSLLPYSFDAPE
jgi:hypothetical protein